MWVWASSRRWWRTGKLACCSPLGRKESDTAEWLNRNNTYSMYQLPSTCTVSIIFCQATVALSLKPENLGWESGSNLPHIPSTPLGGLYCIKFYIKYCIQFLYCIKLFSDSFKNMRSNIITTFQYNSLWNSAAYFLSDLVNFLGLMQRKPHAPCQNLYPRTQG